MNNQAKLVVLASVLLFAADVSALELIDCDQLMLISGHTSDNVSVFNACDGKFLQNLDTEGRIDGAQATRIGPDGNLYVASEANGKILRYDGKTLAYIDEFAAGTSINEPTGLAFGPDGNLYVASFADDKVIKLAGNTGQSLGEFASNIDGPDAGMVFGPDGRLYVPAFFGNNISVLEGQTGALLNEITGQLRNPRVVAFEPGGGNFLVSVSATGRISKYSSAGVFGSNITSSFTRVSGMAFRNDGALFAISSEFGRAREVDLETGVIGSPFSENNSISGATFITFMDFEGMAAPAAVNTNQLWVVGLADMTGLTISLDADAFVFATGGLFGDAFDPAKVTLHSFGSLAIELTDCAEASLTFNTEGNAAIGSGGYPLQKIGINRSLTECQALGFDATTTSIDALTGAWFGGPARDGEGFFIDVLENNTAVVSWFTYGAADTNTPFVSE